MSNEVLFWVGFNAFIALILILDLGVFHRKAHVIKIKEALLWCAVLISLALLFNLGVYFWKGPKVALEFLTGYLIEQSLSVDNLFVFLLIFSYFNVPSTYQHRVLFWGILGAVVMRIIFILAGITLIERFHWIIYIFGGFLVLSGVKLAFQKDKEIHPEKNPVLRVFRRFVPVTRDYHNGHFFVYINKKYLATPLFVVLLVVETTDVMFALDSIPAVLAITTDPFIVYTSNVFAILGLRAIYFALAGVMRLFHYLHYGLSFILVFVGVKMLISGFYKMPVELALGVIAGVLSFSVIASVVKPREVEESGVGENRAEHESKGQQAAK
ncbi:MAG TPA: TerC family protein [Thermodesulfobacteriota bacterium]|nr:TerC family protein [Thermodesulfobacteriota bacterium]